MIVDPDFPDHWKTRLLVDSLDGDEAAPIYVIRIWAHCQNRRTNTFQNLSSAALKALCRYPGHPNQLESGLVASGFVRREGQDLIVHEWDRYNASLIASWRNGGKGGRPRKPDPNQPETHGLATDNPSHPLSPIPINGEVQKNAGARGVPDDPPDELLKEEHAVAQGHNAGVPEDFARFVWQTWAGRDGKDGGGVKVRFVSYLKKRWNIEGQEWQSGTHNGKKQHDNTRKRGPGRIGGTHDPTGKTAGKYAGV